MPEAAHREMRLELGSSLHELGLAKVDFVRAYLDELFETLLFFNVVDVTLQCVSKQEI